MADHCKTKVSQGIWELPWQAKGTQGAQGQENQEGQEEQKSQGLDVFCCTQGKALLQVIKSCSLCGNGACQVGCSIIPSYSIQ